jgi:hypothetical protein
MIQTILLPLAGSWLAEQALLEGRGLARAAAAAIVLSGASGKWASH